MMKIIIMMYADTKDNNIENDKYDNDEHDILTYDNEDSNDDPPDVRLDPGVSVCPGDVPDVDGGPAQPLARHTVPHHALHPPVGRPEELHQRPLVVLPLPRQAAVRVLLWSSYTHTPQSFIDLILFVWTRAR